MNNKKRTAFLGLLIITSLCNSCKDKGPQPGNEPKNETELITTVQLELTDSVLFTKSYAVFRDLDGDGGNNPSQFDSIKLSKQHTYLTRIYLLDESKTPADTISNDVLSEAKDHLFVFTPSGVDVKVKIEDKDDNNLPLGLLSIWRAISNGTGKMKLTLKHQPGVKNGTPEPGETDVEVNFNCIIN